MKPGVGFWAGIALIAVILVIAFSYVGNALGWDAVVDLVGTIFVVTALSLAFILGVAMAVDGWKNKR